MVLDATSKSLLGTTLGLQSTALMAENAGYAMRSISGKKKKKGDSMMGLAVKNIIGTGLIGAQANIIAGL
jgi:hypothetical protein